MKVCIGPLELDANFNFNLIPNQNPGIGGSEHYFLLLAHKLAMLHKQITVTVLFKGVAPSLLEYENSHLNFEMFTDQSNLKNWDIGIFATGFLAKQTNFLELPNRIIAVSHHPHDGYVRKLRSKREPFVVVSLGRYQYLSNSRRGAHHVRIPSFFLGGEGTEPGKSVPTPDLVGHISSLHPSKGFHVIARQWKKVRRCVAGARLEVLGGISLYGHQENHSLLPTTRTYGDRLTTILGKDLGNGTVSFLGRVPGSIDEIVKRWSVALINPNGIGEADPATLRDLIRIGVPVVSSRKYGLSEYMDHFPETTVKNARSIPRMVKRLLSSHELRLRLIERNRELSKTLMERNQVIEGAWSELIFKEDNQFLGREDFNLRALQPIPALFRERLTVLRNEVHSRLHRLLERIFSAGKAFFL